MTSEVTQAALCTCAEVFGEDPNCPLHGVETEWAVLNTTGDEWRDQIIEARKVIADLEAQVARLTAQSGEGRSGAGEEAVAEEAARSAMRNAEVARTDIVKPVNGSAPYTVVMFHGQRVEFHDGEWTIDMHRDAGTGKAAAYAQAINSALFDLAKNAALAALNARQSGEGERDVRPILECPNSPMGKHQIDTSMEEGPHHCFNCGVDMRAALRATDDAGGA
ncbi:MAG: hypothetical protein ACTHNA_14015 [Sphingopyxis terrae]|uniref:hypothetical protein n=1 Tax=Sphingopyxis terrae TaxID=33052 RepID=UPI003F7F8060